MQVVNVSKPNSSHNSTLLAVFQARDSTTNHHTDVDQYREQITEDSGDEMEVCNAKIKPKLITIIHTETWRYKYSSRGTMSFCV